MSDTDRATLAGKAPQCTARGYTGHEHLGRTGPIHMNGRVYDPVVGRFLSPDPVVADASFSQSWNAYSYALNSPLSYSDPSGLTFLPGCHPGICGGGAYGGHGGFGPGSVTATSHRQGWLLVHSYELQFRGIRVPGLSGSPFGGNLDVPGGGFGYGSFGYGLVF